MWRSRLAYGYGRFTKLLLLFGQFNLQISLLVNNLWLAYQIADEIVDFFPERVEDGSRRAGVWHGRRLSSCDIQLLLFAHYQWRTERALGGMAATPGTAVQLEHEDAEQAGE